jgi:hypothetical protein
MKIDREPAHHLQVSHVQQSRLHGILAPLLLSMCGTARLFLTAFGFDYGGFGDQSSQAFLFGA